MPSQAVLDDETVYDRQVALKPCVCSDLEDSSACTGNASGRVERWEMSYF